MLKFKDGMKVSATIDGLNVEHCVVHLENDWIFLCQDYLSGGKPTDGNLFGFKYAWRCKYQDGVLTEKVTNVKLHVPTYETLSVGDYVKKGTAKYSVGAVIGNVYVLLNSVGFVCETVSAIQLKAEKYELLGIEPEEVTEEELFAELGRPIKIVKKKK